MIPKRAKISRRSERFFASLFTLFFSTLLLLWIIVYRDYDRILVDFGKNKGFRTSRVSI